MKLADVKKGLRIMPINLGWIINKPMAGPMICTLFITKKCNSKCIMCNDWKMSKYAIKKELSTGEIKNLIDDLKNLKTEILSISGGEPLLRKDLYEIIDYTKKSKIQAKISTNATLINKMTASKLAKKLDFISVSLDGSTPQVHDAIRGTQKAFELTVKGIKNLVKAREKYNKKLKITIATTISKKNVNDLPDIVKFSENLGIDYITLNPIQCWIFLEKNQRDALLPTPENMEKIMHVLKKMKKEGRVIRNTVFYLTHCIDYMKNPRIYPLKCKIPYINTYIDSIGKVFVCQLSQTPIGNIRKEKLSRIWYSKIYNKKRGQIKKGICERCWWTCTSEISLTYSPTKMFHSIKDIIRYFI